MAWGQLSHPFCYSSALAAPALGVHVCSRCRSWPGVIWTCLLDSIHSGCLLLRN